MRIKSLLIFLLSVFVMLTATAYAQEHEYDRDDDWENDWDDEVYHFEDSFTADLGGIDKVSISIVSGGITVETWGGDSVDITVDEKVRKIDEAEAERIASEVRLVGRRTNSTLIIELDYGDLDEQYVHRYYSSALTVRLPARLSLDLETVSGGIKVGRMEGDVDANAVSGGIELEGCGGSAYLKTVSGGITAGPVEGELEAEAVSGGLDLVGGRGDIEGKTVSGGIKISLPMDVGYSISASTFSGRVKDELGGGFDAAYDRRHKKMKGTFGDGQYRVRLRTMSGGITIKER